MLVFLVSPVVALDEPIFEAKISSTEFPLDESVTLTFYVRANTIGRLRFPAETDDFIVAAQSTSTNIKIINGERSQQHRITLMLNPKHLGKITIPAAAIEAQGITYSSDPVTVNVVAARSSASPSPITATNAAPVKPEVAASPAYNVFAKLTASNLNPYVGEQIKLKLRVYHQGNLRNIDFSSSAFTFDNFIQEKIDGGVEGEEVIDGQKYFYYEMASILFPVKAGRVVIPEQTFNTRVLNVQAFQARAFDPFAQLMTRSFEESKVVTAPSITINVQALPQPIPKGFSGYSGTLSLNHRLDKNSVEEGSAAMLISTASGTGNPKSLNLDLLLSKSNQYTVFEDKKSVNASVSGGIKSFSLTARKALIAKRSGKLLVEVAPLVYFNTSTKRYESTPATKLYLDVQAAGIGSRDDNEQANAEIKHDSEPEKLEIMMIGAQQILGFRKPVVIPLWLMLTLILLLNLAYLIYSLREQLKRLSELDFANGMTFAKATKIIKDASSIETISVIIKEFSARLQAKSGLEDKISEFMQMTDLLLYSGEATNASKLESVKVAALAIIEEMKRNVK